MLLRHATRVFVPALVVALLMPLGAQSAHADERACVSRVLFPTIIEGELVNNRTCIAYHTGRGVRGSIEFFPPISRPYQLAGRFFVTLERNGNQVARSVEHVNPLVRNGTSWATTYVGLRRGVRYCTLVKERRTPTINDTLIRDCTVF